MGKPLFILQPQCNQRLSCKECRDTTTDVYRRGWAERYEMPKGWPDCPFGYPMGFTGTPDPVPSDLLAILVDLPDSPEAVRIQGQVQARAAAVRPVCLACPGRYFRGVSEDGMIVDCAVGYTCCGGGLSRGNVYLGSGNCLKGYWTKAPVKGV